MRTRFWMTTLAVAALIAGCSDSGPTAGLLTFSLTTPNGDDGAVAFTLHATAPATITGAEAACTGCRVFSRVVSETEIRGIVTGTIGAGPLVRVTASDLRTPTDYTATVQQVATRTYGIRGTGGYSLTVQSN